MDTTKVGDKGGFQKPGQTPQRDPGKSGGQGGYKEDDLTKKRPGIGEGDKQQGKV